MTCLGCGLKLDDNNQIAMAGSPSQFECDEDTGEMRLKQNHYISEDLYTVFTFRVSSFSIGDNLVQIISCPAITNPFDFDVIVSLQANIAGTIYPPDPILTPSLLFPDSSAELAYFVQFDTGPQIRLKSDQYYLNRADPPVAPNIGGWNSNSLQARSKIAANASVTPKLIARVGWYYGTAPKGAVGGFVTYNYMLDGVGPA